MFRGSNRIIAEIIIIYTSHFIQVHNTLNTQLCFIIYTNKITQLQFAKVIIVFTGLLFKLILQKKTNEYIF